jgi:ADP-ribosyl-[dinitrogen reductase] hydrolase
MMDMPTWEDRARGTLLGLAWGDVLGCPIEGWRKDDIDRVYGAYTSLPVDYPLDRIQPAREVRRRLRPLGIHSDDTQQALALIAVCLGGPWSPARWAEWLVVAMQRGALRGYGRNFQQAVHKLARGAPPEHAGSASAGMGAAMRIAPLGAVYRDKPEELAQVAMESSLVTHGDLRAGAIAYAVARSAALLIGGEGPAEVRARLADDVAAVELEWIEHRPGWGIDRSGKHLVSQEIRALFTAMPDDLAGLRATLSERAKPHLARGFTRAHVNQGFVILGGLHGLAVGLFPGGSPAELLASIMGQGHDTDTVGAIAGGLLGARFGTGWIPMDRLRDGPRLEVYADALVTRDGAPERRDGFIERERELTDEEKRYQIKMAALG